MPNASLVFTVGAHRFGTAKLRLNLTDSGGTDRGGADMTSQLVEVLISPVNDAPTIALASTQVCRCSV